MDVVRPPCREVEFVGVVVKVLKLVYNVSDLHAVDL